MQNTLRESLWRIEAGRIALGIGLELQRGEVQVYSTSTGAKVMARLHRVRLTHEELGDHGLQRRAGIGAAEGAGWFCHLTRLADAAHLTLVPER